MTSKEAERLEQEADRSHNWKRWGPYLSERQWGTVREDYSKTGECWEYFPHDHARSRAYRWGEDGLMGICDRQGRMCFALALWNGRDPILKERLYGLTGYEGNHGEDVKELYYYLDATPSGSYLRGLYKYPHAEYPYAGLLDGNRERGRDDPELELLDTGALDEGRYFDVDVEYAKAQPEDILVRISVSNRGPEAATLHVLPTVWFRNTWSWGRVGEGYWAKPRLSRHGPNAVKAEHSGLGPFEVAFDGSPALLFTDNETNSKRLWDKPQSSPYCKDAFHHYVIDGRFDVVHPGGVGTKAAAHYQVEVPAGQTVVFRARISASAELPDEPFGADFDAVFATRIAEADEFYAERRADAMTAAEAAVVRQSYAGLLWTNQFYHYVVRDWLDGDSQIDPVDDPRATGRNADWKHLYNRDVISMPDKWEYPWYAAWDLAFHMIPYARIDPHFAKDQLQLFLREWYMHPNGQIPAYEFAFGDVNPPVHAWAAWRVYKMTGRRGLRDNAFLARVFQKLLLNFTWWVNRKDESGRHVFSGGFLGLDNIGIFDRSQPLPTGGVLQQADGTAWMAFYAATMMAMALELAWHDKTYEDMASKFFEHFVRIIDAMNGLGGTGLWDEEDGFYYDQIIVEGRVIPLKTRSWVGIIPLFAVEVLEDDVLDRLPGFEKRTRWFLEHRADLARHISYMVGSGERVHGHHLLALPSRDRLVRVLEYVLDENEFLSPYGVRSLSRVHEDKPYVFNVDGRELRVEYDPGESTTGMFGGNSNWRGPIWFPLNFLLIEALERYHHFYHGRLEVECPTGSGVMMTLDEVADELRKRLSRLFLPDETGKRACHGPDRRYRHDEHFKDLVLFYEYFHGEDGKGLGASHQTGWTALVGTCLEAVAKRRECK